MSTNTNPNAPYVFFYSKFCSHCRRAMDLLKTHPIGRQSLYLCVDDKKGQLPPAVRAVPTFYDRRTKQYHVGEQSFKFLQEMSSPAGRSAAASGTGAAAAADGPGAYHSMEMNGFSDHYAYIDSSDAMPKAFGYLTDNGGYGPAPAGSGSGVLGAGAANPRDGARDQRGAPNMAPMMPSHGMPRMGGIPETRGGREEKKYGGDIESAYEALLASRKMDLPQFPQRQ